MGIFVCFFLQYHCHPFEVQLNNNNKSPKLNAKFHNRLIFYGEDFLAPHPTHKLGEEYLLAVHGGLFNLFL
jgi:hypothetical protein